MEGEVVQGICKLIQEIIVPLMTEERALRPEGRREIVNVREEGRNRLLFNEIRARALS
ncbi:hypothetical protein V8C42DRAFT_337360 [Trichoderma barbatum]